MTGRRSADTRSGAGRARARARRTPNRAARSRATGLPDSRGRSSPEKHRRIVDPRVEQRCELAGEIGRRLHGDLGWEQQARAGDRPRELLEDGSAAAAILVPGQARKFWTITSCTWPCRACAAAIASIVARRSSRVSPIPISRPVVNGTCASPARPSDVEPGRGLLVGRAEMRACRGGGGARRRSRASGPSRPRPAGGARSRPPEHTGVQVGEQPGLLEHRAGRTLEVLEGGGAAERGELVACDAIAKLRLVAEREKRLRQPAAAPARATSSTSSSVMNARSPRRGGCANVQ